MAHAVTFEVYVLNDLIGAKHDWHNILAQALVETSTLNKATLNAIVKFDYIFSTSSCR